MSKMSKNASRNAVKKDGKKVVEEEPTSSSETPSFGTIASNLKTLAMSSLLVKMGPKLQPLLTSKGEPKSETVKDTPTKVDVTIVKATNLKDMNFSGNSMYCLCEGVKGSSKNERCRTAMIKSLNPVWDETHSFEWQEGEDLHFTIMDKAGIGGESKEGAIVVPASEFYPTALAKELYVPGLYNVMLQLRISVPGSTHQELGGATEMLNTLTQRIQYFNCLGFASPATADDASKAWRAMKGLELDWGPRKARRGNPSVERIMKNVNACLPQYIHILLLFMLMRTFIFRSFFCCLPWVFVMLMASVLVPVEMLPQVEKKFRVVGTFALLALLWFWFFYEIVWKTYFFEKIPLLGLIALHAHSVRPAA